jgi:SAM-dependent methyltransferase
MELNREPVTGDYVISPEWGDERERLELLGRWLDPSSIGRAEALGVAEGWNCLEIGAGGGSLARALGARVGPAGRLLAVDIDTRFLDDLAGALGVEVRQADVRVDEFPAGAFDLVHTRLVLTHLPERLSVMKRIVDWLAPGGWVLFEEIDIAAGLASPHRLWARHWEAYRKDPGYDACCGRALPAEVTSLGLEGVGMEIETPTVAGGTELAHWHFLTNHALRPGFLATGAITATELDELGRELERPGFLEPGMTVVAVWGRKPAGA